ncbi:hypothetical protein [Rhizobium sp. SGZ-381]
MIDAFYRALDWVDTVPPLTLGQILVVVVPMLIGLMLIGMGRRR